MTWLAERLKTYDLKEWAIDMAFAFGVGIMVCGGLFVLFGEVA